MLSVAPDSPFGRFGFATGWNYLMMWLFLCPNMVCPFPSQSVHHDRVAPSRSMLHDLSFLGGQTESHRMHGWPLSSFSVRPICAIIPESILTSPIHSRGHQLLGRPSIRRTRVLVRIHQSHHSHWPHHIRHHCWSVSVIQNRYIFCLIIPPDLGGNPHHDRIGFRYWQVICLITSQPWRY